MEHEDLRWYSPGVRSNGMDLNMMLLGKRVDLSESMKRNICLLPGVAVIAYVLLVEFRYSRKSIEPASQSGFHVAETSVLRESTNASVAAVAQSLSNKAIRMPGRGVETDERH